VGELFDLAFARLDRAEAKRVEFGNAWADYISQHPWDIDVVAAVEQRTYGIFVVMREAAPALLSMIFSEWLAVLRAALDNGFYAWVAAATGQDPPPDAERLQYPICASPAEFKKQTRGATPEKVKSDLLDKHDFTSFDQPESFRFKTEQMRELSDRLRGGERVTVPSIASDAVDVALARQWALLWTVGDNILPLAFRSGFSSDIDAVLCLLLDAATGPGLGLQAFGKHSALIRVGLTDEDLEVFRDAVLHPALEELVANIPADAVLENLRVRTERSGRRRPRRIAAEKVREDELNRLRGRLQRLDLIPGLTVHQAKGREWDRVGIVLSPAQEHMLDEGLRELVPEHCVLYVALTRAKLTCGSLRSPDELGLTGESQPSA
jgi:DNA helicase II / ATP-dependent DNA helicase PcrA